MKTIESYYILLECGCDDSAIIEELPEGVIEKGDFNRGNRLSNKINGNLTLRFSEDYPEHIKLYDFVENTMNFLIISERLKAVLESEKTKHIEYIPVDIVDHKGNIAGKNYNIVNFLKPQPIIDMNKSEYSSSDFDDLIFRIELLHLDISNTDQEAKLFRATTEESTNFITDDLLQALEKANITGIKTIPAEGWNGDTMSFI